jgi:hypothetical protein
LEFQAILIFGLLSSKFIVKLAVVLIDSSRKINKSSVLLHKLFMSLEDIVADVFNGDEKVV